VLLNLAERALTYAEWYNKRILAIVLLVPFSVLTLYSITQVGYIGIFDYQRHSPAGWQVFADLVIALFLVMGWIILDAKKSGRNPWPWLILTLFFRLNWPAIIFNF
jgi:hypothetical protein